MIDKQEPHKPAKTNKDRKTKHRKRKGGCARNDVVQKTLLRSVKRYFSSSFARFKNFGDQPSHLQEELFEEYLNEFATNWIEDHSSSVPNTSQGLTSR